MRDGDSVWVLHWKYGDGSGYGVVRVYGDKQRADEDMDLLSDAASAKQYKLTETCFYCGAEALE